MFLALVNVPSPSAFLYLAQLSDDDPHAALSHYQTAIDILQSQLKGKSVPARDQVEDEDDEIKSNIVRAYLGMVEIWMDPAHDLWCVLAIKETSSNIHTQVSIPKRRPHATRCSLAPSPSTPSISKHSRPSPASASRRKTPTRHSKRCARSRPRPPPSTPRRTPRRCSTPYPFPYASRGQSCSWSAARTRMRSPCSRACSPPTTPASRAGT